MSRIADIFSLSQQRMTNKILMFSLLGILTSSAAFAQNQVLEFTDSKELENLSAEFARKDAELQSKIEAYATKNGLLIHHYLPTGKVMSFVDFDTDGKPVYVQTDNAKAASTIATSKVYPSATLASKYNLAGRGFTVGEWDGGSSRITHREYQGRAFQADNSTMAVSEHATHVGGTLIAGGVTPGAKGMAYQAKLLTHDWTNDDAEMAAKAAQGLLISNHSYGTVCGWEVDASGNWAWNGNNTVNATYDYKFGYYDTQARDWDRLTYKAPFYLVVKSAGNSRDSGPSNDPQHPRNGPYDCLPTYSIAKNILTVGAVNGLSNGYNGPASVTMSSFSSWGPADDGRIKPDIVGDGVNLNSCGSAADDNYASLSGTSMSGPSVAGSCLLLQEFYSNTHFQKRMKSATLKGLVIHTADECFNPSQGGWTGPDYRFGWGLMNTKNAADLIYNDSTESMMRELVLDNQQPQEITITAKGTEPLVATICWTDYEGTPGPAAYNSRLKNLVNDLDLRVCSALGSDTTFPWKLNPDSLTRPARKGDNSVDNVEKIELTNPVAGQTYKIRVSNKGNLFAGTNQPQKQAFSLIVSGIVEGDTSITCIPRQFMNSRTGIFDDGSGSTRNYAQNADCGWVINPEDSDAVVQVIFRSFNVAAGDTLYAYSGNSASGALIGKFSGSSLPDTIKSSTNQMFFNFKSTTGSTASGWEVSYKAIQTPKFDFTPQSRTVCSGSPISFSVQVLNGPATGWNYSWDIPGSSNQNPIVANPTAQYDQIGVYPVSLTVSNEAGPKTITKTALITVKPALAPNPGPNFEGFESSSFPNNAGNPSLNWTVTTDVNTWQRSSLSPFEGLASARIKNFTNKRDVRELVSPAFDLSGLNIQRFLKFRYAYARMTTAASADQFRVLASSDCGRTWTELLKRNNTTNPKLSTIGDAAADIVAGTFIPEPNQYRSDSLSLNSLVGAGNNISVKFEMTSELGNYLYLDNVTIGGIQTSVNNYFNQTFSASIAPNPGDGNSKLLINLVSGQSVRADLIDVTGKLVSSKELAPASEFSTEMQDLFGPVKPGIFIIRLSSDAGVRVIKWENKN